MPLQRRRRSRSVAAQAIQLGIAAPQVVAHRIARMAAAGTPLSVRDSAEFRRMGIEKLAAANEAWAAMAGQACVENQKLALSFLQSLWFPWLRPTPRSVSRRVGKAAARVLGAGLGPVRRRAVANARRLGRRK